MNGLLQQAQDFESLLDLSTGNHPSQHNLSEPILAGTLAESTYLHVPSFEWRVEEKRKGLMEAMESGGDTRMIRLWNCVIDWSGHGEAPHELTWAALREAATHSELWLDLSDLIFTDLWSVVHLTVWAVLQPEAPPVIVSSGMEASFLSVAIDQVTHACTCARMHTHARTRTHAGKHTHTHTRTRTCTHTHNQVKRRSHMEWLSAQIQQADMRGHGREMRAILHGARADGIIDMSDANKVHSSAGM